jgi:L-phenylalanine/L-methionine N-acetyltransferase
MDDYKNDLSQFTNADGWRIRARKNSDLNAIFDLYQQSCCYQNALHVPFSPMSDIQLNICFHSELYYSLVAYKDDMLGGQVDLEIFSQQRRKHAANLGIAVHPQFQRQGIGSLLMDAMHYLAFQWLGLHRLELEVFTNNEAGVGLYKKQGYQIEGKAEQYAFRDGQYADIYQMAKIEPLRQKEGNPAPLNSDKVKNISFCS